MKNNQIGLMLKKYRKLNSLSINDVVVELEEKYGKTFSKTFFNKAELLKEAQLINFNGETLSLTDNGMLISNSIITELTEDELNSLVYLLNTGENENITTDSNKEDNNSSNDNNTLSNDSNLNTNNVTEQNS